MTPTEALLAELAARDAAFKVRPTPTHGALGWPLVPSPLHPGELALACPKCHGTDVEQGSLPYGAGSGPNGRWRSGDRSTPYCKCLTCKHRQTGPAHSLGAPGI